MIVKETLVDLREKYEKVRKLIEEDARFDPETQPYFSKYSATTHLKSMNLILEGLREKEEKDSPEYVRLIGMQGVVNLQLGILAIDTEEPSLGEKHLTACANLISTYEHHKTVASCNLNMLNQLGMLHANRESEKGKIYLEKAEEFYKTIKNQQISPVDFNDVFAVEEEIDEADAARKFEKLFTLTLYYLAQVYAKFDHYKSAIYCHRTLQRQLESEEFEVIDWVLNTATLSQFMTEKNGFRQARHHLSASSYMLDKYEESLREEEDGEEHEARLEVFRHRSADVARCWANYGIRLLVNSRNRLLEAEGDSLGSACTDFAKMFPFGAELTFPSLDLRKYEEEVTDQFVLTLEDAKPVFLHAQRFILKAQEYYKLETLASDFIEIAQDHAKLYDALVFFEECPENRTKLMKRAIDVLEEVIANVNPTYYMQFCRPIWFRVAMFYSDILDLKLEKLKDNPCRPTQHALTKINRLVDASVKNFTAFSESFRNASGEFPGRIGKDHEKAFLQAVFHVAALETRRVALGKEEQLENVRKSLECYKRFVEYCEVHEGVEEEVKAELSVAKEMVVLLPLKIAKSL